MYFRLFLFIVLLSTLSSCARRGRPQGGPKDEDKPIMVKANPEFGSIHFNANEIKIYFDEYIKLKDLTSNLIVSPPLKYPTIVSPQGTPSKYITIELRDTLQENTTYTFNFGQSIIDNTEGNILENFKYIVSTGDYIDSLKIQGTIKDAFELEPDESVILMLYAYDDEFNDSIIFNEKPMYVGAMIDSINYEITNIKDGKYALVALNDVSKNYKYNAKEDKIGFPDEIISVPNDDMVDMVLFKEILPYKISKRAIEDSKGHLFFGYEGDATDMKVEVQSRIDSEFKSFSNFDKEQDTLHYWFRGYSQDSINFIVRKDSLVDRVSLQLREDEIDSLTVSFKSRSSLNLRDTFNIKTNTPIVKIDTSKIVFINADSTRVPYEMQINKEMNIVYFEFKKDYDSEYNMQLLPGAITDFFDVQNDTLETSFKTKRPANFSSIFLTLKNVKSYPIIVHLLNQKGEVEATHYARSPEQINFENVNPSRYMVRIIYDENENKKWDTGNYLDKIQPEKVYYFKNIITAKANWEIDETLVK